MSRGGRDGGDRRRQTNRTDNTRAIRDEREVVLLALLLYEKNETFSNVLVRQTLDSCREMTASERAFVKRLLEGVIERRLELDDGIRHLTGRSVNRLHPVVRQVLRMGLYQILYMDSVPARAACNEAVRLARKHGPARLTGFVNGVLRNAAREEENRESSREERDQAGEGQTRKTDPAEPGKPGARVQTDPAGDAPQVPWTEAAAKKYSFPVWLTDMWGEELGREETEALLNAFTRIFPVSARVRCGGSEEERQALIRNLTGAGVIVEAGKWLPDSMRLKKTSDLRRLPGFSEGLWTVQDESSMLAVEAAGLQGQENVYDVCAAPGGKSFLAADLLRWRSQDRILNEQREEGENLVSGIPGTVYSFDLTRKKTDRIREGARRLRIDNLRVDERDARLFSPEFKEKADVIFCDLPCSGLGVIGKKRDIKYRASLEKILSLQALQRQILANAVSYLRSGGVLIYSTCTISRRENEENASWIQSCLGLVPEDLEPFLPAGIPGIRGNSLQLLPHIHGTDGFFVARFRKT